MNIIYEDNHLIAVYKSAGTLVQAGDARRVRPGQKGGMKGGMKEEKPLLEEIKEYLKKKYVKPGNVFLGIIHRLDRNVAGIVLFAKTSKGAARLSEQFREHMVDKIYHAWVEGDLSKEIGKPTRTVHHFLVHDENQNKTSVHAHEVPGSDYAELSYEVIRVERGCSLLKIKLGTGRQHQIRAQMAHLGYPILGDSKYGARKVFADQHIALYATELHFNLATKEARKVISIPIPEETW